MKGRKGYALIVDATFGALIAVSIMVVATTFMNAGYSAGTGTVSVKRMATDVMAVLDYNGTLDTLDENMIRSGVRHLLPPSLEMGINITVYDENLNHVQETNINFDTEKDRLAGKRGFMTFSGNQATGFAVAEYWVAIR